MGQLYIPDESWLICSDGMNKQQLKVTSQSVVRIAGGKPAATIEDRTGKNFICGKMLIAGAVIGAAIAALVVSTGGMGFLAALGAIAGSAIVGTAAGAALGTLLSLIPCFCALFTMSNDWEGCHPQVLVTEKQALLENATLACMLGGKIEIHIFAEFAEERLSEIRKNILIEAGVQALKVTLFCRFPLPFIFGSAVAEIGTSLYTGPYGDKLRTGWFAFCNPNAALKISEFKPGSHMVSTNVSRAQSALSAPDNAGNQVSDWEGDQSKLLEYQDEQGEYEGTQSNAFRHALWQAEMARQFGGTTAQNAGNAHEPDPYLEYPQGGFDTMADADSYVDQRNNEIGRRIGAQNPGASQSELAALVLDYYCKNGLWEVEYDEKTGKYIPVQKQLPQEQYDELKQAVETMNRYGYLDNALDNKLKKLGISDEQIAWFKSIPRTNLL